MADTYTEDTSTTLDTTTLQAWRHEAAELEERMRSVSRASSITARNIRSFVEELHSANEGKLPKLDLLRGLSSGNNQAARSQETKNGRAEEARTGTEAGRHDIAEEVVTAVPVTAAEKLTA